MPQPTSSIALVLTHRHMWCGASAGFFVARTGSQADMSFVIYQHHTSDDDSDDKSRSIHNHTVHDIVTSAVVNFLYL